MGVPETNPLTQLSLPPGFRFYPTDEELLVQYLCRKVAGHQFSLQVIGEIDLYKFDPWVLPSKAMFGEKEWYFFSPRDRKYPNGSRPNRVAGCGYWKATGTDKLITSEGRKVGIKKALVFYVGKAPKGTKTNWIMHEYRLIDSSRKKGSTKLDDWVLCRIYKKNSSSEKPMSSSATTSSKENSNGGSSSSSLSLIDDVLESLPEIDDRFLSLPRVNSLNMFQNLRSGNFDWASLAGLNSVPEFPSNQSQAQAQVQRPVNYSFYNDTYVPPIPALCHLDSQPQKLGNSMEDEVQSGPRTKRVERSGVFPQNLSLLTPTVSNFDPYGFQYPTQTGGFGFRP